VLNLDPGAAAAEDHAAPSSDKIPARKTTKGQLQKRINTSNSPLANHKSSHNHAPLSACEYNLASTKKKSSADLKRFSGVLVASQPASNQHLAIR
jgi:hypothetical protein